MTEPCARYFAERYQLISFIAFVGTLSRRADEAQRIAAETLARHSKDETDAPKSRGRATATFRGYSTFLLEMLLTRSVDNFLCYVADLLAIVFTHRPEALRSKEQLRVDFVLGHDSMEELVESIAERRVERLTYAGLRPLREYLENELGYRMFEQEEHFEIAVRLVEKRNLIVHNRGVVNSTYLSRLPDGDYEKGQRLALTTALFDSLEILDEVVFSADGRAASKWSIPQPVEPGDLNKYASGTPASSMGE